LRGAFRLEDLAPGTYVLQLSAAGMVDAQSRPIEVSRGRVIHGEQIAMTAAEVDDSSGSGEEPTAATNTESTDTTEAESDVATKGEALGAPSQNEPPERSEWDSAIGITAAVLASADHDQQRE